MVINRKTRSILEKSGFIRISTSHNEEWWVIPISGRALNIVSASHYKPLDASKFKGVQSTFKTYESFMGDLMHKLNDLEHDIIQILFENE